MVTGALALVAPVSIAVLVWWWRSRRTGRHGKSLWTFLLGYAVLMEFNGLRCLAQEWARPTVDAGDCVLVIVEVTVISYFLGWIGWIAVPVFKGQFSGQMDFAGAVPDRNAATYDARQRTIEECAEHAYEHVVENETTTWVDRDRAESTAARVRDAILALGEKED